MIRLRDIASAALLRFLPATAIGTIGITALLFGPIAQMPLPAWLFLGKALLEQTAGFALTLLIYRRRLGSDAAVSGSRTLLVGAFGTALLVGAASAGGAVIPRNAEALVWTLTGAAAAAIMYWPWLRRRPTEHELATWEAVDLDALASADSALLTASTNAPARDTATQAADQAAR